MFYPIKAIINAAALRFQENVKLNAYNDDNIPKKKQKTEKPSLR